MDSCTLNFGEIFWKSKCYADSFPNMVLCLNMHEITAFEFYIAKQEAYEIYKNQCTAKTTFQKNSGKSSVRNIQSLNSGI